MGLVDWRIVVAVGVVGLLVLLIGLRGRRADQLPRCKRRRCGYDLSAVPTVVLRPDPAVARTVVGMDEIWDGVIELPITIKERDEETKMMYRLLLQGEQQMRRSRSPAEPSAR